jgi:hypothetical protein
MAAFVDDHEEWVFPYHAKYKGPITEFFSFLHGRSDDPYPKDGTFTQDELLSITPSQV